jgi:hypothetical protein
MNAFVLEAQFPGLILMFEILPGLGQTGNFDLHDLHTVANIAISGFASKRPL